MGVADDKLQGCTPDRLIVEVLALRMAIRDHRDQKGHDRCWLDDVALYKVLPEAGTFELTLPPRDEFLTECARYWERRRDGAPIGS